MPGFSAARTLALLVVSLLCVQAFANIVVMGAPSSFNSNVTSQGSGVVSPGGVVKVAGASNSTVVGVNGNTVSLATSYVASRLGQQYFNRFVTFQSATGSQSCTGSNCTTTDTMVYSYSIPYENNTTTTGTFATSGGAVFQLNIMVIAYPNGPIVAYRGPEQPYYISVSQKGAVSAAESAGLGNATTASIVGVYNTTNQTLGYRLVWAVTSDKAVQSGYNTFLHGLYIDISSGQILGEFQKNTAILSSGSALGFAKLGNFTIFNITRQQSSAPMISAGTIVDAVIVLIIIIVAVVLIYVKYIMDRDKSEEDES
ncbi:MAG: hypothetical protein KGH98_04050 [Candidatus Micrarchaeota archaeon]|nr:hypothetical protein [Candidatus Micrarchaeota archaeon]